MTGMFRHPKRKLRKMIKNGEYKEAISFGRGIEEEYSGDPDFLFIMGSIYYMLGNADNSIHYFDRALQINDSDAETLLLKANVHLAINEKRAARECCTRILKVDPENAGARDMLGGLDA